MLPSASQLITALKNFVTATGKTNVVLGLSGGVDSALTAAVAVRALGKDAVTALVMPHEGVSSKASVSDATTYARELGIRHDVIPIGPFVALYKTLPWISSHLADVNIQARVRATILYHFANTHEALVLGTGNKTELQLGYFTKYGDGACDVLVIGSLYKTDVWRMARELGVPEVIGSKIPSAELAQAQTDEEELGMPYATLDAILKKLETGEPPTTTEEKTIARRMTQNQHKLKMPTVL